MLERVDRLALPAALEVQLDLVGVGAAHFGNLLDVYKRQDYIHYNPVKHGFAASAIDWPYSTFRRHVEAGVYAADWGRDAMDFGATGHE